MYEDFTYYAITIIPSFRVTGILSVTISSIVIIWSVKYIQRKYGALFFLVLSVFQMLVSGGWVIDLAIITSVLASRIGKPMNWWLRYLPSKIRIWVVRLFPVSLLAYTSISLSMLLLTIFGVNDVGLIQLLEPLAVAMFIPIFLMILGGFACDIHNATWRHEIK
ncbi:hypothetical protein JXL21_11595 [Candidatus Bathyarchaeota archaeon]|nr:hypothetical protein [Candidatus Bathyarchaeota archaeon]